MILVPECGAPPQVPLCVTKCRVLRRITRWPLQKHPRRLQRPTCRIPGSSPLCSSPKVGLWVHCGLVVQYVEAQSSLLPAGCLPACRNGPGPQTSESDLVSTPCTWGLTTCSVFVSTRLCQHAGSRTATWPFHEGHANSACHCSRSLSRSRRWHKSGNAEAGC